MDIAWQCLTGVETFTSCRACWDKLIIIITIECYNIRSITKQNISARRIYANSGCKRNKIIHLQRYGRPRMWTWTTPRLLPRRSIMRFIQRTTKPHRSQVDVQASGQPQRIRLPPTTTATKLSTTSTTTTTTSTSRHHTSALKLLKLKLLRRLANNYGRRQTCNLAFVPGSLRQHEEGRQGLVGIPGARDGWLIASRACCTA